MSKSIDLGKKWNDDIVPISMSEVKDKVHYPDFHISDTENVGLLQMPEEGTATIKYRIVSRQHSENKRQNGKKEQRCSITLEVLSIDPPESKPKKKNGDSDGGLRKAFSDYFKEGK